MKTTSVAVTAFLLGLWAAQEGPTVARGSDVPWAVTGWKGVKVKAFPAWGSGGEHLRLLKIEPGSTVPRHTHHVSEVVYLISGTLAAGDGKETGPGTQILIPAGAVHGNLTAKTEVTALSYFAGRYHVNAAE